MCYSRYDDERDDGIPFFRGLLNGLILVFVGLGLPAILYFFS